MRAIDVIAADDDDRELETLHVRVDKHFRRGFTGSIGIRRSQNARLQQVVVVVPDLAVNLVGGDVDESVDPDLLGALQHDVGAVHIGMGKDVRVAEAQINMRLGGEVEDGVDFVTLHAVKHLRGVRYVPMVEAEVALVVQDPRVVE